MGLVVWSANRLEALALALAHLVDKLGEPLTERAVLVPSWPIASYLKLALAEANGVEAGLTYGTAFLQLATLAERASPGTSVLRREALAARLAGLFVRGALPEGAAPPARYLGRAGSPGFEVRAYELAAELAALFFDYELTRPELARRLVRGELDALGRGDVEHARWQSALLRELFDDDGWVKVRPAQGAGIVEPGPPRETPRERLFSFAVDGLEGAEVGHGPLFVVGFSYLPPLLVRALALLSRASDVVLLARSPCLEFWEDLRLTRRGGEPGAPDDEPQLLSLSGRAGRSFARGLGRLVEGDVRAVRVPPADTLLGALQTSLLERRPFVAASAEASREGDPRLDDGSLVLLSCPTRTRLAEAVAELVAERVRASAEGEAPLRFHEVAVLVPSAAREALLPRIGDALHALGAPVSTLGPSLEGSGVREAATLLLALPESSFARRELLPLLVHPNVARPEGATPRVVVELTERLGVRFGADAGALDGTYLEHDAVTWQQAQRRVALGAFMAGADGDAAPFEWPDERGAPRRVVPEEIPPAFLASAAHLFATSRELIDEARALARGTRPLSAWGRLFARYVARHVAAETDAELAERARIVDALSFLGRGQDAGEGEPLPFSVAVRLALARVEDARLAIEPHWGAGVALASLSDASGAPFRLLVLAGLDEGALPSPERPRPFDLLRRSPEPDEALPADLARDAFLGCVTAATETLALAWVGVEPSSGEPREPSAVVRELLEVVYPAAEARARLVVEVPLARHTPPSTSATPPSPTPSAEPPASPGSPAGRDEARAVAIARALEGSSLPREPHALCAALDAARPGAALGARLGRALALTGPLEAPERPLRSGPLVVSLVELRRFLECPLQGAARFVLRLREEQEDLFDVEDERLTIALAAAARRAVEDVAEGRASDVEVAAADEVSRRELVGAVATGPLAEHARLAEAARARLWLGNLDTFDLPSIERFEIVRFGRAPRDAPSRLTRPPIAVGDAHERISIVGETVLVSDGREVALRLSQRTQSASARDFVDAALSVVALAAAGEPLPERVRLVADPMVKATRRRRIDRHMSAPSQPEAQRYLATLARELVSSAHAYLLPIEAVERAYPDGPFRSAALDVVEGRFSSSNRGPVPHPERFEPLDEALAQEAVRTRFGLIDTIFGGGQEPEGEP